MTDTAGRPVVIGSACRCTIFQPPSSRAMIIVARRLMGVTASCPSTLAWDRSTLTRYAISGVAYLERVSASPISPSRSCDAAWSTTAATCSTCERVKGVTEGYVLSMGVPLLYWFRISFQKFTLRQVELRDQFV